MSRSLRRYDEPIILGEDILDDHNGVVSTEKLQRARKLDQRNKEKAKEAEAILRKVDKKRLDNMSKLNDYILAEGVEQLETESGREKFLENLKKIDIHCDEETLMQTVTEMNLIPSYAKEQVDIVSSIVSSLNATDLIYDECVTDDVEVTSLNLISVLNIVSESTNFYEDGYVDMVARMYRTEGSPFPTHDHEEIQVVYDSLVADSEKFIPYALSNLVEDSLDDDEPLMLMMTETDCVDLLNLRTEIKDRARSASLENLNDRRIRERNERDTLELSHEKKMSLTVTRLRRKKEESSQESNNPVELTEMDNPEGKNEMEVIPSPPRYTLRPRRKLHYSEEEKVAPNWQERGIE